MHKGPLFLDFWSWKIILDLKHAPSLIISQWWYVYHINCAYNVEFEILFYFLMIFKSVFMSNGQAIALHKLLAYFNVFVFINWFKYSEPAYLLGLVEAFPLKYSLSNSLEKIFETLMAIYSLCAETLFIGHRSIQGCTSEECPGLKNRHSERKKHGRKFCTFTCIS